MPNLEPLNDLTETELRELAEAVVSSEQQRTLSILLERNYNQSLSNEEASELDRLINEIEQVALLKARALYTLQLRHAAT